MVTGGCFRVPTGPNSVSMGSVLAQALPFFMVTQERSSTMSKCTMCGVREAVEDLLDCYPCMEKNFMSGKQIARMRAHLDVKNGCPNCPITQYFDEKHNCEACVEAARSDGMDTDPDASMVKKPRPYQH